MKPQILLIPRILALIATAATPAAAQEKRTFTVGTKVAPPFAMRDLLSEPWWKETTSRYFGK